MDLNRILDEIVEIFEGICMGTISASVDPLDIIMNGVPPQEVLDEIISPVGFKARSGVEPTKEEVQKLVNELKRFKEVFNCIEVENPIEDLENYLKQREQATY